MQTSAMIVRLMGFHGNSPFCYLLVVVCKHTKSINEQRMLTVAQRYEFNVLVAKTISHERDFVFAMRT